MQFVKQRLDMRKQNYIRALSLLEKQASRNDFEDENIAATLHFYEMAFELAWKLLKDFLEIEGFVVKSPREVIKTAYSTEYIKDGFLWIEMLGARNTVAHMYDENIARQLFVKIKSEYIQPLAKLRDLV